MSEEPRTEGTWAAGRAPRHWLDWTSPETAENLALDEALLEEAQAGTMPPTVRIWEPATVSVVLGASGRIDAEADRALCEADGIPIWRRSSGGGTVVIGPGTLNVAVVLPTDFSPALAAVDEAQKYVLGRLAWALRRHAPGVELRGSGDLTLGPRKFSGSAQRRVRHFLLIHATILYGFELGRIGRYLRQPARQPEYRLGRPHNDFVTNLPLSRDRIVRATREAWLADPDRPGPVAPPIPTMARLLGEKFADPRWICRF